MSEEEWEDPEPRRNLAFGAVAANRATEILGVRGGHEEHGAEQLRDDEEKGFSGLQWLLRGEPECGWGASVEGTQRCLEPACPSRSVSGMERARWAIWLALSELLWARLSAERMEISHFSSRRN